MTSGIFADDARHAFLETKGMVTGIRRRNARQVRGELPKRSV